MEKLCSTAFSPTAQLYFIVPCFAYLIASSGRDKDKIAEVGFTVEEVEGQPAFAQSKCVLICKKMYQADILLESMSKEVRDKWYSDGDYHTMYIGEIVGCYVNR